ncbi:hypothetical protein NDU88_006468 [Pleurodeles waltl]|uniref:Uncharacterized protein n=1 Tax=Pleurodeles waltl TaxID=8319 RepID=A0AAV7UM78_PLEWA|nr:hypothetical protein NDU88_006468 [Pleurodeles waltl]
MGRPGAAAHRTVSAPVLQPRKPTKPAHSQRSRAVSDRPVPAPTLGGARSAASPAHQTSVPSWGPIARRHVPTWVSTCSRAPSGLPRRWSGHTGTVGSRPPPPLTSSTTA